MDIDLRQLPGPAPHYVTVAMAQSDFRAKRFAWPISGDHTARAKQARADRELSAYIHLAKQRYV